MENDIEYFLPRVTVRDFHDNVILWTALMEYARNHLGEDNEKHIRCMEMCHELTDQLSEYLPV